MATGADFSIRDVLAWARTKPADEWYNVNNSSFCALGQFGTATGRTHLQDWFDPERRLGIDGFNDALGFGGSGETTFGALVKRLEALCPETPLTKSDWLTIDAYMADIEQVSA